MADVRRGVPRTDVTLADPRLEPFLASHGRDRVRHAVRTAQQRCRDAEVTPDGIVDAAVRVLSAPPTRMRRVVNASGVLVHTNLGRAPLSAAAVEAVGIAAGATDVELDLATGRRGPRGRDATAALRAAVPAAGDALVVNNGAAALALAAVALAGGREIVVARGELVEIGDGFRIPELLETTGARLREVGTTNRVSLADYAKVIGEATAFVLKVHPSNFVVRGFTSTVPVRELATLPVPIVADIGSGLLEPHDRLPDEPDATTSLQEGAAVVTASGDKLLGGPQCGLVLGEERLVQRLRRHPLSRALRVDKLRLAALEATLTGPPPPVSRMLLADRRSLRNRAERLAATLRGVVDTSVVDTEAAVGGGGAPEVPLPSVALSVPEELAAALRLGEPAVVGRLDRGRLLLDLVAVDPADDNDVAEAVRRAAET